MVRCFKTLQHTVPQDKHVVVKLLQTTDSRVPRRSKNVRVSGKVMVNRLLGNALLLFKIMRLENNPCQHDQHHSAMYSDTLSEQHQKNSPERERQDFYIQPNCFYIAAETNATFVGFQCRAFLLHGMVIQRQPPAALLSGQHQVPKPNRGLSCLG